MIEDIFISPHPDDIAYSCFGAFHLSESPHLLTVFGRSKYSADIISGTIDEEKVTEIRKNEDRLFAEANNASYFCFDFPDSSLTLDGVKEVTTFQNPYLEQIKNEITNYLAKMGMCNIYIPIGNGWHNDHRDIHRIMVNIYNEGCIHCNRLFLYEDLPYFSEVSPSFSLPLYLQSEGVTNVNTVPLVFDLTEIKSMWINCYHIYRSQYDINEFNQIIQYKYSHKANRLQEILWKIW